MSELYDGTYARLPQKLPEVERTAFYQNCVSRDCKMDVMIEVALSHRDGLQTYLDRPLHHQLISAAHAHITQRVSFDWEGGNQQ